ncbi:MAG: hypothetical protein M3452_11195 [Chloroflexota bacterium]|nr:hypothetical protein [Chloroflexota bacterium]
MAFDFLDGIRRRASSVDMPDRREFSLPDIDLKNIELPKIDLHDLPRPDLAAAGRAVGEGVGALGKRIDEIGRDMRQVRVVKGPEPRVAPAAGIALLGGIGAGMGLMYFMDPRVGQQRRDRLVSRIKGLFGQAKQAVNDRRGATQSDWDDIGTGETEGSFGSDTSLSSDPFLASPASASPLSASSVDSSLESDPLDSPELAESRI